MTVPPDDVVLGVTHLSMGGELIPLFKCPFCNFKNIHEEEIRHHIRYKEDAKHAVVDADKIDIKDFIVTKNKKESTSRYTYTRKEDLPDSLWPWIKCVWCEYRDRLPRDLQWHFIEKHKNKLYDLDESYHLDPSYSLHDIESTLDKALDIAKRKSKRGIK